MCGIAGMVELGGPVEAQSIRTMLASIRHRGPCDSGVYVDQQRGLSVGLGTQRLSIIDLSPAGHQPMANETGEVWIAYNGELYNHEELRVDLERRGHVYRSRTDTETVLHAYEEYDVGCFQLFNGMFACSIYDRSQRRVVLGRDRMGIKPLYYRWDGATLVFGSEMKSLVGVMRTRPEVSPEALDLYLSLGYVPAPYCMYQGVQKLPPGSYAILEGDRLVVQRFWSPRLDHAHDQLADQDLIELTRDTVAGAIRRQLMSDVPVGAYLSGGLDSSIIASEAQRAQGGRLHTFSVGFAESDSARIEATYNTDLHHAREFAHYLGTEHHEVIVRTDRSLEDLLRTLAFALDEPLWEGSFLSLHLLSLEARAQGIVVALTGDGSDELFGGYPWYLGSIRSERYEQSTLVRLALPAISALFGPHSLGQKARDLQRRIGQSDLVRYRLYYQIFRADEVRTIAPGTAAQAGLAPLTDRLLLDHLAAAGVAPLADKFALLDLVLWVRQHFNQRIDRMAMHNSVEARVPFQDNSVVDLALGISMTRKLAGGEGKYLLRRAFADCLPKWLLTRRKRPFAAPTTSWLRGPLRDFLLATLAPRRLDAFGLLVPSEVDSVVRRFLSDPHDNGFRAWVLLMLQLWCEAYR